MNARQHMIHISLRSDRRSRGAPTPLEIRRPHHDNNFQSNQNLSNLNPALREYWPYCSSAMRSWLPNLRLEIFPEALWNTWERIFEKTAEQAGWMFNVKKYLIQGNFDFKERSCFLCTRRNSGASSPHCKICPKGLILITHHIAPMATCFEQEICNTG